MLRKLTVLYIGNFSPNSVGEPEIAKCLEKLGHIVDRMEEHQVRAEDVLVQLKKKTYDFLFMAKGRVSGRDYGAMRKMIEGAGVKTVVWSFDLYYGL